MKVLAFNKASMVELNDTQMRDTDSGITPTIIAGIALGWVAHEIYDHFDGDED